MKYQIESVSYGRYNYFMEKYGELLAQFNLKIKKMANDKYLAYVSVDSLNELQKLIMEIEQEVIISPMYTSKGNLRKTFLITIHDGYVE